MTHGADCHYQFIHKILILSLYTHFTTTPTFTITMSAVIILSFDTLAVAGNVVMARIYSYNYKWLLVTGTCCSTANQQRTQFRCMMISAISC